MSIEKMRVYLADALDQEACKNTLFMALQSRVQELQLSGVHTKTIIDCLDDLCDDPYQMNDNVIQHVMETLIISSI